MTDVTVAVREILDRADGYAGALAYYDGNVNEVVTVKDAGLRAAFARTNGAFKMNFCRPVVDSVLNRLEVAAIVGTSDQAGDAINKIWEKNEMLLEASELHRAALVFGDAYAIVWPDEDGEVQISTNTPLTTTVVYDPESPRRKAFAAKMWLVDSDPAPYHRLNLYYEDRIEKYKAGSAHIITPNHLWDLLEVVDNPFGEVPVFHFRTHRPFGRPEHRDAFEPQDMINKLLITEMYTVDYQGAPQRYALSAGDNAAELEDFAEGDTDRENIASLKNGPGELWYLKGVTNVGQFSAADPDSFWKPIKDTVRSMASITSTPLHYFERTGNVPSGEALRTAEAPLLKKVSDRQISFGTAWRDLFRFVMSIEGIDEDVQVKWRPVESMDSLDAWDVALKKRNAGVPLIQVLLEQGYDLEIAERIVAGHEKEVAQKLEQDPTHPTVPVEVENSSE